MGLFYTISAVSLAVDSGSTEADSKRTVQVIAGVAIGCLSLIMACGGVQAFSTSMSSKQHELMWGSAANLILIAFFSAPLSSLAHVLRTRCSATIYANWPLSVVSTANSALWTAYGFAISRPFVWAPNSCGCVLGVVQLLLCVLLPTKVIGEGVIAPGNNNNKAGSPKGGEQDSPRLMAVSTPAARGAVHVSPLEGGGGNASGRSSRSSGSDGGGGIGAGPPIAAASRSLSRAWSAGQWSAAPGQPPVENTSGVRQLWSRLSSLGGSRGSRNINSNNVSSSPSAASAAAAALATNSRRRLTAAGGRDSAGLEATGEEEAPETVSRADTVKNVDVEAAARR